MAVVPIPHSGPRTGQLLGGGWGEVASPDHPNGVLGDGVGGIRQRQFGKSHWRPPALLLGSPIPPQEQRDAQKDTSAPPVAGRDPNAPALVLWDSLAANWGVVTLFPHRMAQTSQQGGDAASAEETLPEILAWSHP